MQVAIPNEPRLLRAVRQEQEFTAQCVRVWGEQRGPMEAQRLIARFEREQREGVKIVRAMTPEALRVLAEEMKGMVR